MKYSLRSWFTGVAALTTVLMLATAGDGWASNAHASSSVVKAAEKVVAAASRNPAEPVPTTKIKDIAKLRGKTVYYIPLSTQVPQYAFTGQAIKNALKTVGVKVYICDGQFTPTGIDACFNQAIGAHVAGIVTSAIEPSLATSEIEKANKEGIGVVLTDIDVRPGLPKGKHIAYINTATAWYPMVDGWVTANSGGKADVLFLESANTPTSVADIAQYADPDLKKQCPNCKASIIKITSTNENLIPSVVSSAVLKNPKIDYVFEAFDEYTPEVIQGLQQAKATTRVKIVTVAAAVSGLQDVASSSSPVKAEAVGNQFYNGWSYGDEVLRMMAGQAPVTYGVPVKLFSASNIGTIKTTNAAESVGAWFGSTAYVQQFKKLWGVG